MKPTQLVPTIRANGINIYYEIHGVGEPLLLIPGLALDVSQIETTIRGLSQKCQVIAFDNRGAGRTDKPDIPYSIEVMAEDAAGLLDALSVAKAHILGISMGGRIALALALGHPELVKSLILASTCAKGDFPKSLRWRLLNLLLRVPMLRTRGDRYPQPYYAYVRQREASGTYDATDRLHEIHVPTVILHGKNDVFVPYQMAEETHKGIRGSSIITFDGGHLFLFMRQKEFLDSVLGFLESQIKEPTN